MVECTNCEETIDPSSDTRYETVTPVQGGGQTSSAYCSVACLNEDVGFSDADIESLMRQSGYEVPPDLSSDWVVGLSPGIQDVRVTAMHSQSEFHYHFEHVNEDYDIELRWDSTEELYEIALYTYDVVDGEKMGLEDVAVEKTGVHQRAVAYAEEFMERVE